MTPTPQGRSGAASSSMKLGAADPRNRRNAQGGLTDDDVDQQTIELRNGQLRVKALDGIGPLAEDATLAQVIARLNALTRKAQGG